MLLLFRKQILDELVLEKITSSRATAGDRGQAYIQAMEGFNDLRLQYLSESSFALKIQSMGMTTNAYRLYMQKKALTQQVLKREMKSKTMVREVQIQEFYNENMDLWKVPESADVEHILLAKIDVSTGRRLNPDERAAKQHFVDSDCQVERAHVALQLQCLFERLQFLEIQPLTNLSARIISFADGEQTPRNAKRLIVAQAAH